jgi:hypothetical protein
MVVSMVANLRLSSPLNVNFVNAPISGMTLARAVIPRRGQSSMS